MSDYNLRLYTSVLDGASFVADLTKDAIGWKRSIRNRGGYWQGEFTLMGELNDLARFFYEYLGYHLVEKGGGAKTWEGMIYEMELSTGGASRRRSLDNLYNYVFTTYTDPSNNKVTTTVAQNEFSIAKYGRREEQRILAGQADPVALTARNAFLAEYAFPTARCIGITSRTGAPELRVTACGYIFTASWRFESVGDDSDDNLSGWISDIVDTDCEFLLPGHIETNTRQVRKETKITYVRAWDVIQNLLDIGIPDPISPSTVAYPTRAYVYNDRRFNYEKISTAVNYYWRNGMLRDTAGAPGSVNPWTVKPGVVRDLDYPVAKAEPSGWLLDGRDFFVEEVEYGANYDQPVLKAELYDESEILTAAEAYKRQAEQNAKYLEEQAKRAAEKEKKK